jgi:hypothetical protein
MHRLLAAHFRQLLSGYFTKARGHASKPNPIFASVHPCDAAAETSGAGDGELAQPFAICRPNATESPVTTTRHTAVQTRGCRSGAVLPPSASRTARATCRMDRARRARRATAFGELSQKRRGPRLLRRAVGRPSLCEEFQHLVMRFALLMAAAVKVPVSRRDFQFVFPSHDTIRLHECLELVVVRSDWSPQGATDE